MRRYGFLLLVLQNEEPLADKKKWQEGLGGKNEVTRATQVEEAESGSGGSRSSSSNCCKVMIGATK
jgi:hypothetical protein